MAKTMVRIKSWGREEEAKDKRSVEKVETCNIFKPRKLPFAAQIFIVRKIQFSVSLKKSTL
jgi:hypothetical protein